MMLLILVLLLIYETVVLVPVSSPVIGYVICYSYSCT